MSPSEIEKAIARNRLAETLHRLVVAGASANELRDRLEEHLAAHPGDFDAVRAAMWRVAGVRATLPPS